MHDSPAQPIRLPFKRIGPEQGLSHQTVTDIIQDRQGFVWFTTLDGLSRFDGYSCIVYRHIPGDNASLPTNFLHAVREDEEGLFWITSRNGGLKRFDPKTGRARSYLHNPHDARSLAHKKTGALLIENDSLIWVGTDAGLELFNKRTSRFRHLRHNPKSGRSLSHNEVTALVKDRAGTIWVGTFFGLNRFDRASGTFRRYMSRDNDPSSLDQGYVQGFLEEHDRRLWVGTSGGLNILDRQRDRFVSAEDGARIHQALKNTRVGKICFATRRVGFSLARQPPVCSFLSRQRKHCRISGTIHSAARR